ncbi:hypothetical protein KCG43_11865 [Photobacterium sp. WH24]|uniref:DUF1566 domain-containing protein n=1 Tax=Photobacterium sp. WH24 TaxID=2827237 RepID=UPI001C458908|nr:DUF1566 domain-containing protein [Photobacterium sp. WH24]MBV7262691.1 hypothetical protein [Photobacterium sp. WH24]
MKSISILIATLVMTCAAQASDNIQTACNANYTPPSGRFTQAVLTTTAGPLKVVNDKQTGLQWQFCSLGQLLSGDQLSCQGDPEIIDKDAEANAHLAKQAVIVSNENSRLGETAHPWRAPDVNELLSIYNNQCSPALYPAFSYPSKTLAELQTLKEAGKFDPLYHRFVSYSELYYLTDSWGTDGRYAFVSFSNLNLPLLTALNNDPWGGPEKRNASYHDYNIWGGMLRLVREIP